MPWLEQIKRLAITLGKIPEYSLNLDLPLTQTLQCLTLEESTSSWILGRTFKALREFLVHRRSFVQEVLSGHEGLQVCLPACTTLQLVNCSFDSLRFLSCPHVQILRWSQSSVETTFDLAAFNLLRDFLFNLSCLQKLYISISLHSGIDSLIRFFFCDAREQGVWRDIRSVEVVTWFSSSSEGSHFFNRAVSHQWLYQKRWKEFIVTKDNQRGMMIVKASV